MADNLKIIEVWMDFVSIRSITKYHKFIYFRNEHMFFFKKKKKTCLKVRFKIYFDKMLKFTIRILK
jgi:hypothetical protein